MCSCEDGERATVFHAALVRARKAHRCYECNRTIAPGDRYERSVALFEGSWDSTAVCLKCNAIRQAWHDVEGCWAPYGSLRGDILDDCLRELRRQPPDDDYDKPPYGASAREVGERDPGLAQFGVRYRTHLGKYGPQLPRRAA